MTIVTQGFNGAIRSTGERKLNMTSVGGKHDKLSTRKANRIARSRGFINAKQMFTHIMTERYKAMIRQQQQHPEAVGSLDAVKEAA